MSENTAMAETFTGSLLFIVGIVAVQVWNSEVLAGLCFVLVSIIAVSRTIAKTQIHRESIEH
jgi:hypothetical protein